MPAQGGSRIHSFYELLFRVILVSFLLIEGSDLVLEKIEPVLRRWNAVVKAYGGDTKNSGEDVPQPAHCVCQRKSTNKKSDVKCSSPSSAGGVK
jgi:hypothetical protein